MDTLLNLLYAAKTARKQTFVTVVIGAFDASTGDPLWKYFVTPRKRRHPQQATRPSYRLDNWRAVYVEPTTLHYGELTANVDALCEAMGLERSHFNLMQAAVNVRENINAEGICSIFSMATDSNNTACKGLGGKPSKRNWRAQVSKVDRAGMLHHVSKPSECITRDDIPCYTTGGLLAAAVLGTAAWAGDVDPDAPVDYVQVDTEGFDLQVIHMLFETAPAAQWPALLMLETKIIAVRYHALWAAGKRYIERHGYVLIEETKDNTVFMRVGPAAQEFHLT